jgi:hypothetical protein
MNADHSQMHCEEEVIADKNIKGTGLYLEDKEPW